MEFVCYGYRMKIPREQVTFTPDFFTELHQLLFLRAKLNGRARNIVLEDWIDYQTMIGGKTIVWYYCDILDDVMCEVI